MSYLFETPPEPDELSPDFELCLRERDRIVYELRRKLKAAGVRYQFLHNPPLAGCGLVLRDPQPLNLLADLQQFGFLQASISIYYKDVQSETTGSLIRIIVRNQPSDPRQLVTGPVLLISTHTL